MPELDPDKPKLVKKKCVFLIKLSLTIKTIKTVKKFEVFLVERFFCSFRFGIREKSLIRTKLEQN